MTGYSKKPKDSLIAKMLPPNNVNVLDLSRDTGIPESTLYTWRSKNKHLNAIDPNETDEFKKNTGEEKLTIVIETSSMNESELSEYCRRKGLYPYQIKAWREACVEANELRKISTDRKKVKKQASEIKQLEKELRRKEKALAEAAALLILKKKAQEIWGDPEEGKSR
jgi:transposase